MAMEIVGYILFTIGCIVGLVGDVMILTAVYRRGTILFIVFLVLPVAALVFSIANIRKMWLPLGVSIGGCLMAFFGVQISGSENLMEVLFG